MAVFLDVLPRLGLTEAETAFAKLKEMALKTGKEMGVSLGDGASAGLDKLKESAISAERVVSDANRKMALSAGQLEVAQGKATAATEAATAAALAYADAERAVAAAGVATLAQSRELDALRSKATATSLAASAASVRATDAAAKASTAARDQSDAATVAAAASGKFAAAEESKSSAVLNTTKVLNGVGMASFLAFGAAVGVSANKAADFEQAQTKLVASAGETAQGMKQTSDGILQMAGSVGYSAGELSDAMYVVEKGGFNAAKGGLDVLKASAQGANAEQADLAEVTKGLTISMNDFHFPTANAADVMSKLVVATGASTATFQEFTGALHSVEPAAAAAGIKYEDLLATIAQGTKSGASADQVTENIRNAINALSGAQKPARDAMANIGISADDVSQHLGQRGLAGTMQYLADTVKSKMDPNNLIDTGTFKKNAQELDNMNASLAAMSPSAQAAATGLRNGTVTAKEFLAAIKGSSGDDTKRLMDFRQWSNDLDDFSKRFKNGQSTLETYNQALRDMTGTVAGQTIALQVTGENADATNALIAKLTGTTREHDGTVKGFNETQETLNAKLRDAKAGFGAAATEMGEVFIPVLKDAADGLRATAEFLAAHKDAVKDAVYVVGILGATWATTKIAMALGSTVSALATGFTAIGGFVMGLAGKYDALAVSAGAAAEAEAAAASPGTFAKGGAAGAAARGAAGVGAAALPFIGAAWGFLGVGSEIQHQDQDPNSTSNLLARARSGGRGHTGIDSVDAAAAAAAATPDASGQFGGPGAQAARRGTAPGTTPTPGALPVETAPFSPDPGTPGSDIAAVGGTKPPKGDKNDPIWIAPKNPSDFKSDTDHGVTGSSIITSGPDFSPKGIATYFSALLIDLAVGNPIGKTLADKQKRGDTAQNPMYVTSVDVDSAQKKLDEAIQNYGPDSTEAKTAAGKLRATQAAVGTTGGYYDPVSGAFSPRAPGAVGSDAALLSNVRPGSYSQAPDRDLLKGLSDCSSSVGDLVNIMDGRSTGGQKLTTGNAAEWLPEHGFVPGTGAPGDFRVAYNGGHMQATLPGGTPWNWGSDAAAARGGVGGTGADDPALNQHYYRPVAPPSPADIYSPANTDPGLTAGGGGPADLSDVNFGGGGGRGGMPESPVFKRSPGDPAPGTDGSSLFSPGGILGGGAPGGDASTFGNVGMPATNGRQAGVGAHAGGGNQFGTAPADVGAGVSNAPRTWGSGKGASVSIGSSLISAAGPLAAMAPGSAQAAQLIDRTIGYGAQVGGILFEGAMQSLIPTGGGGGIGDPSKSVLGKIAGGVAGAHKSAPNSAGTTAPPLPAKDDDKNKPQQPGGDTTHVGTQNNGTVIQGDAHFTTPDAQSFASDKPQNIYPTSTR